MNSNQNFINTRCDEYGNQPVQACLPPPPAPWFEAPFPPGYESPKVSFSPYAPAYPARGSLWWNGIVLQIFDGAAWMPTGGTADVTGTAPAPGTIGEVVKISFSIPVSSGGGTVTYPVILVVPSGDWDCNAGAAYDGPAAGVSFRTAGYPVVGLFPELAASQGAFGPAGFRFASPAARLLTTITVPLGFELTVSSPTGQYGTLSFWAWARRAR
jgi:hypothetical protein